MLRASDLNERRRHPRQRSVNVSSTAMDLWQCWYRPEQIDLRVYRRHEVLPWYLCRSMEDDIEYCHTRQPIGSIEY